MRMNPSCLSIDINMFGQYDLMHADDDQFAR